MARSPSKSRSASSSTANGKSPPKPEGECITRKYVILSKELIRKLGETVDSDWNRIKVVLIPHSKTTQAVIVELVGCINEYLALDIPDG